MTHYPAFVLLDMFMPSLNGIETIEKLIAVERPMRLRLITGVSEVDVLAAQNDSISTRSQYWPDNLQTGFRKKI